MKQRVIDYCDVALLSLSNTPVDEWASAWVCWKMAFMREFAPNYVFSTSHGIDFFQNVLDGCNGFEWSEKGEYGERFRRFIKELS